MENDSEHGALLNYIRRTFATCDDTRICDNVFGNGRTGSTESLDLLQRVIFYDRDLFDDENSDSENSFSDRSRSETHVRIQELKQTRHHLIQNSAIQEQVTSYSGPAVAQSPIFVNDTRLDVEIGEHRWKSEKLKTREKYENKIENVMPKLRSVYYSEQFKLFQPFSRFLTANQHISDGFSSQKNEVFSLTVTIQAQSIHYTDESGYSKFDQTGLDINQNVSQSATIKKLQQATQPEPDARTTKFDKNDYHNFRKSLKQSVNNPFPTLEIFCDPTITFRELAGLVGYLYITSEGSPKLYENTKADDFEFYLFEQDEDPYFYTEDCAPKDMERGIRDDNKQHFVMVEKKKKAENIGNAENGGNLEQVGENLSSIENSLLEFEFFKPDTISHKKYNHPYKISLTNSITEEEFQPMTEHFGILHNRHNITTPSSLLNTSAHINHSKISSKSRISYSSSKFDCSREDWSKDWSREESFSKDHILNNSKFSSKNTSNNTSKNTSKNTSRNMSRNPSLKSPKTSANHPSQSISIASKSIEATSSIDCTYRNMTLKTAHYISKINLQFLGGALTINVLDNKPRKIGSTHKLNRLFRKKPRNTFINASDILKFYVCGGNELHIKYMVHKGSVEKVSLLKICAPDSGIKDLLVESVTVRSKICVRLPQFGNF